MVTHNFNLYQSAIHSKINENTALVHRIVGRTWWLFWNSLV